MQKEKSQHWMGIEAMFKEVLSTVTILFNYEIFDIFTLINGFVNSAYS